MRGINSDGVQKFAADEFDARDEWRGRLDVTLNQRDAVHGVFKISAGEMFFERGSQQEKANPQALAGAIVVEDHRIAEAPRSVRDIFLADHRQSLRGLDADLPSASYCATLESRA